MTQREIMRLFIHVISSDTAQDDQTSIALGLLLFFHAFQKASCSDVKFYLVSLFTTHPVPRLTLYFQVEILCSTRKVIHCLESWPKT